MQQDRPHNRVNEPIRAFAFVREVAERLQASGKLLGGRRGVNHGPIEAIYDRDSLLVGAL
jgi:hypothetical protein